MSELTTIARPYAKAAFEYAVEQQAVDSWLAMITFAAEVSTNEVMQSLVNSPAAGPKLAELFIQICGEQLNEQGQNFIKVMAENGRLSVLPAVLAEFVALKSEWEKQLEAYVRSASALSQAEQDKICTSLEQRYGCTVKLHCSVDPALIAGLVIKAGDEVIDATVRSKLNRLAEALQS